MRRFQDHNPAAVALYYLAAAGVTMFTMEPVILVISLTGAVSSLCVTGLLRQWRAHLYTLLLFAAMALVNPLVSHNGVTVLFVLNHNPVTLEACIYGIAAGVMIVTVMTWFRAFTAVMTSDKLLYIFGSLSPKLALMLSMALRYVPLFGRQVRAVGQSQTALGLYKEDNIVDRMRGGMRIFSVMVTWTLENGIITADSMTARGYGTGRRTRYTIFRWTRQDVMLLVFTLLLTAVTFYGLTGRTFTYYPAITASPVTGRVLLGYIAYGLLTWLPLIITGKEALKWHILRSRI